ncbi:MAG: DUF1460 domain-containing protein [Muribaculaceae bacterium]|nr:DUF1460 domain-containing protein [Muribaculaceae bacterium]
MQIRYMRGVLRCVAVISVLTMATITGHAYEPRIHCEEDTVMVSKLLQKTNEHGGTLGDRCVYAAKELVGTPWAPPADNDSIGTVVVNMHGFDRLGFVNTVLAIAEASRQKLPTVREFVRQYESFSRRKGEDDGFASQLIYGADWVVDNVYRGNLKEMTEYLGGGGFKAKTLDYITRHREDYPALKDEATYDKVRMMEMGYRSHRIPHMKKQSAGNKTLHELMKNGDVVMMLSPEFDFDIYDIGIVEMKGGEPYMIHISPESGVVVADPYPMQRLFKLQSQHFYGYRWMRPQE